MSNPPFPTDAGSGADGSPRRSGLRLSEADIIASARLDVLGDGTLKEALSGVPDGNPEGAAAHDASQPADRFGDGGAAPLPSDGYDGGLPPAPVRDPSEWIQPAHSPPPASARPADVGPEMVGGLVDIPSQDFLPLNFAPVHFEPAPAVYGDAASRSGLAQLDLRQPLIGAQPTVEVSPILSALDAAERLAEEAGFPAQAFDANGSRAHEFGSPMPPTDGGGFDARPHSLHLADRLPAEADPGRSASRIADPGETADVAPQPPGVQHPARDETAPAAKPMTDALDTAAKLVAEASVTAEALEGLKRLLERRLPTPDFAPPPSPPEPPRAHPPSPPPLPAQAVQRPAEPMPIARAEPVPVTPAEPLPAPAPAAARVKAFLPVLSARPRRSQGVDVHGFIAGFGLSLAVGVLLYLFMTTG